MKFDDLPELERERILTLSSHFHYRDGKTFIDGSMGSIHITFKELRSILTEAYSAGVKDASKRLT